MRHISITLLAAFCIVEPVSGKAPAAPGTGLAVAQTSTASTATDATNSFPKPSEWPTIRRDGTLQARSPLKGKITNPKIVWKKFIGSLESQVVIEPGDTQTQLNLPDDEPLGGNDAKPVPIEDFIPNL